MAKNNIIKKIAKGLSKEFEISRKEATAVASEIAHGMNEETKSLVHNNFNKIEHIISGDKAKISSALSSSEALKEYATNNSFKSLEGVQGAIDDIKKEVVNKATSNSKFVTEEAANEAYEKLNNAQSKFDINTQSEKIKDFVYKNKAENDEVFKKYYDSYNSTQRTVNKLGYDVDETTKKEIFGDNLKNNKIGDDGRVTSLMNDSKSFDDMMYNAYSTDKEYTVKQATERISNSENSVDKAINKKRKQTFEEYTTNKYDKKFNESWEKYSSATDEEKKKMNDKFDIGDGDSAEEKMRQYYNKQKESGGAFGIGDRLSYYQVPQKAVGIGATAWLVSNMCSSKGQMDNSQLYGQQPPYQGGIRM